MKTRSRTVILEELVWLSTSKCLSVGTRAICRDTLRRTLMLVAILAFKVHEY
jgi:hypothetical protein